jgi:hypothetical protein
MALSIEERKEISRRNGARSRGPTSNAGKFISSRNSIKHGYYAVVHNLPDEDPLEVLRLRARWFADVAPKSIAEEFLTQQFFQAHLHANRVERARRARLTAQMEAATASWHDQRDAVVGKLWRELFVSNDAKDILIELQKTTLGLRALSGEWSRLKGLLEGRGYWLPPELEMVLVLNGTRCHPRMLYDDEDAYRLFLWNFQCEPEPPRDMIERMLVPENRPLGLYDVDGDVLLPSVAECLARLKQWADDVLEELHEESERVWTEVEAPELARRTDPKAIVVDAASEAQIHRASNEYRAMYYKAHNALEAIRKREAAEEKEARKNADWGDSRQSDESRAHAGCAGRSAPAANAPAAAPAPNASRPVTPACVVEVKMDAEAGPGVEPGSETENQPVAGREVPGPGIEAGARNEPGFVTETPVDVAVVTTSIDLVPATAEGLPTGGRRPSVAATAGSGDPRRTGDQRSQQRWGPETHAEQGAGPSQGERVESRRNPEPQFGNPRSATPRDRRGRIEPRNEPAPGSADDWRRPPTVTQPPGSPAACKEPWPYLLDPRTPLEELSPQERSVIEAFDRETMAELEARLRL